MRRVRIRVGARRADGVVERVENRTYDAAGRLTKVANVKGTSTLSSFSYTLDPGGNPTLSTGAGTATAATSFKYDNRDRITEICYQTTCTHNNDPYIRYTYDAVGNRLTESRPTSSLTNYSYNADDELTATSGSTVASYSYDANGNETAHGSETFSYGDERPLAGSSLGWSRPARRVKCEARRGLRARRSRSHEQPSRLP
jgi:RHS Repeat